MLFCIKIAKYEEMQAQMKSENDSLQTQYNNCQSQV